jgi:hypothetical protein
VQLYDKKLVSKSKYIEELKEKNREMAKEQEEEERTSRLAVRKLEMQVDHLNEQIQKAAEVAQEQGVNIIEEI